MPLFRRNGRKMTTVKARAFQVVCVPTLANPWSFSYLRTFMCLQSRYTALGLPVLAWDEGWQSEFRMMLR